MAARWATILALLVEPLVETARRGIPLEPDWDKQRGLAVARDKQFLPAAVVAVAVADIQRAALVGQDSCWLAVAGDSRLAVAEKVRSADSQQAAAVDNQWAVAAGIQQVVVADNQLEVAADRRLVAEDTQKAVLVDLAGSPV